MPPPASLVIGDSYTIKAKAQPDTATNKSLTYTADNGNASVAEDGTVTAHKEGSVTITVTTKSEPTVTKTVTFTIKKKPEIALNKKELEIESTEENPAFTIETLHGKLDYTVEVASDWLEFDKKDSTASETEDTVYLKAKPNRTVWDKTAYIKFKYADGRYIEESYKKPLEVKIIQEKTDNPTVTIKWVHGIDGPKESEKVKIEVPHAGQAKKFYWKDEHVFHWYETQNTKWFNNRKLNGGLEITVTDGKSDSNQCWAKTSANMLDWWFVQNEANIAKYIQNKPEAEKAKYTHYYKRELPKEGKKKRAL